MLERNQQLPGSVVLRTTPLLRAPGDANYYLTRCLHKETHWSRSGVGRPPVAQYHSGRVAPPLTDNTS
jgi:hypothetical protein